MGRPRRAALLPAAAVSLPRTRPAVAAVKAEAALRELERNPALPRTGAAGDLFYRAADGRLMALPAGTDGQVLTMVNGLPAWRNP